MTASYVAGLVTGGIGGFLVAQFERHLQDGKTFRQRLFGAARVLAGLAVLALLAYQLAGASSRNDCLQNYFVAVSDALRDRSQATGDSAASERAVWVSLRRGEIDPRAAAERVASIDRLEAARLIAPLPPPPECG